MRAFFSSIIWKATREQTIPPPIENALFFMVEPEITWLSSLYINAGGHSIIVGVSADKWFIQPHSVEELTVKSKCISLLPLMEEGYGGSYDFAVQLISERLEEQGLPRDLESTFPYIVPVRTAMSCGSRYWFNCAMQWVRNFDIDEEFARELLGISRMKSVDQDSRNIAKNKVKEWERSHNICLMRPF